MDGLFGDAETARDLGERHSFRERARNLPSLEGVELLHEQPTAREFALRLGAPVDAVLRRCAANGVNAGYCLGEGYPEYEDGLLVAITERRSRSDIERLAEVLSRAVKAEREHRQEAVEA